MKNQTLKFAALAILVVAFLGSCKKGENDPFLSLRSRNARITGVWKMTAIEVTTTDVNSGGGTTVTDTYSSIANGSTLTTTSSFGSSTVSYTETLEIRKDGTYTKTIVEDGVTETQDGNWWWLNSNKKKVRIAFDDDLGSYYIDQLKNKEIILTLDEGYSSSSTGGSSSSTSSGKWTYEKE